MQVLKTNNLPQMSKLSEAVIITAPSQNLLPSSPEYRGKTVSAARSDVIMSTLSSLQAANPKNQTQKYFFPHQFQESEEHWVTCLESFAPAHDHAPG
jgi:hypothetical protein